MLPTSLLYCLVRDLADLTSTIMADGVVAEQGSPRELYAKGGIYAHMVDLQAQGQRWTI